MSEKDLSRFLDYRPDLKYEKQREIELQDTEAEYDDIDDVLLADLARFIKPGEVQGYMPSTAILDATDISGAELMANIQDLLGLLDQNILQITKDLRNTLANKPSVDEYIEARRLNDANTRYAFEDYHALNIEGSTAAEALPVLLHMHDELAALKDLLNQELFGGKVDFANLDALRKQEEQDIRNLILADRTGDADVDSLAEDNHLKEFANEKLVMIEDIANQLHNIIQSDVNDSYGGQAIGMVEMLANNSLLDKVTDVNNARFQKEARESEDAKERLNRLSSLEQKMGLIRQMRELQKKKLANRDLLKWMEQKDVPSYDPMNFFLLDVLEGVEEINAQCDLLSDDMYAMVSLEDKQLSDYANALRKKQACRNLDKLGKDMKRHFNFGASDKAAQALQFCKHMNLDKKAMVTNSEPMHDH